MDKFNGYSHEDSQRIIQHFAPLLIGKQVSTGVTRSTQRISGIANKFISIPFNVEQQTYEGFLHAYNIQAMQDEWLATKRRESHRWIPLMLVVAGESRAEYVPLVAYLVDAHLWNEDWKR